ncbi:MAG: class I SAM-dependent methyltransferase [Rhodospirillaceae bacterium]
MPTPGLEIKHTSQERARQGFVNALRSHVLNNVADHMKVVFEQRVRPEMEKSLERPPKSGEEIHKAMKSEPIFKFYSALRMNAQEMCWRSVIPGIERDMHDLNDRAQALSCTNGTCNGSLNLDPTFEVPWYVSELDIHLMPGNYHEEHVRDDVTQAAIYEQGFEVFSMGLLGKRNDDIASSIALFINTKFPNLDPKCIVDVGCLVGHSTLPWKQQYPDAEVHGIDVAAPALRYAHARAQSYGVDAHFHQMSCENIQFKDESFDIVFSSMLLHEMPPKSVETAMAEMVRLLKPGGLLLHYELPPNSKTDPYDSFYLDWDSYYNKEPFYKSVRDMDFEHLLANAGVSRERQLCFLVPSVMSFGRDETIKAARNPTEDGMDHRLSRLVRGMRWYTFGGWKPGNSK